MGVWRTIGGRRVFIKDGQDLETAMAESGKFDNIINKNKLKKELKEALEYKPIHYKIKNVTKEYLDKAKPNQGKITKDDNFKDNEHKHEKEVVQFIYSKFGGNFHHIQEIDKTEGKKYPDFKWDNKKWEIKKASSKSTVDSNLRKAINQVNKSGGIVLEIQKNILDTEILAMVEYRMLRSGKNIDCIIIVNGHIISILRK